MWLSSTIKSNITAKQKAFKKYKQSGTASNLENSIYKGNTHLRQNKANKSWSKGVSGE